MVPSASTDRPWLAEGEEKRLLVRQMFAEIAPTYDVCNSIMSLRLHARWRRAAVRALNLKKGARVLDACCGTGDFFPPLREAIGPTGKLFGFDFCLPMLTRSALKDQSSFRGLGDACRSPYQDGSFDAVTVGWGIRNVPDIDAAHREAFRTLKSGGRFVSIDMARPKNPVIRASSHFIFGNLVPLLGKLFRVERAYKYLPESTERFMTREQLSESMGKAGFVEISTKDFFMGTICMHLGVKP
ncbi:MAG: ubiquinone/menaquinone biosynthesis methyltransferase [Armatimonadetes bacterium]|nr:ubiquinone/menaquinone biosynthesis methyltransferase [Armatimonadota bacterium]